MNISGDELTALLEKLIDSPKSTVELGTSPKDARFLESHSLVEIDPDRFPDEFVPGNPMVIRLPGDNDHWPGWKEWNL